MGQGTLRWNGAKHWPTDMATDFDRYQLREGDVILAMDRPWIEAGLKYAALRASDLPALLVQRVARLRGKRGLDTGFLKCLIGSPTFTEYVLAVQTGTAVPHISAGQIESFEFEMPPLAEQHAIVHILGTLDDKIELNRQMSETLEAMARALFESWFVDFEPVRAKAEGRDPGLAEAIADLFPGHLIDSEFGEIPETWGAEAFGEVVELLRDTENPMESPGAPFEHFSIPSFDDGQQPKQEFGAAIKSLKAQVPPGAVLLSKLNPEIERVWLVDVQAGERAVCSTEFLVLSPRAPHGRPFIFCAARSQKFRRGIEGLVTGTSKSHQRAQPTAILSLAIVRPPDSLVRLFDRAAGPLLDRSLQCRRESRNLADARDTLLPRLISGELRARSPGGSASRGAV